MRCNMGSTIMSSGVRGVHFARQNVTETMREVLDENGVTFVGRVPPGVKVGDPLVVHPREGETWWMSVQGTPEDLKAGKVHARVSLVRDQAEVEFLQQDTEKALLAFVTREFPGYLVECTREAHPLRGVTLKVVGPVRDCHYGSGGKLTPKWLDLVLGNIPHDRDYKHPYVSAIKVRSQSGGRGGPCQYVIYANII